MMNVVYCIMDPSGYQNPKIAKSDNNVGATGSWIGTRRDLITSEFIEYRRNSLKIKPLIAKNRATAAAPRKR
jgi:hypothetical protein